MGPMGVQNLHRLKWGAPLALGLALAAAACWSADDGEIHAQLHQAPDGATVDLRGEVEVVFADSFQMASEDQDIGPSEVLVVPPRGMAMPAAGSSVRIRGRLTRQAMTDLQPQQVARPEPRDVVLALAMVRVDD